MDKKVKIVYGNVDLQYIDYDKDYYDIDDTLVDYESKSITKEMFLDFVENLARVFNFTIKENVEIHISNLNDDSMIELYDGSKDIEIRVDGNKFIRVSNHEVLTYENEGVLYGGIEKIVGIITMKNSKDSLIDKFQEASRLYVDFLCSAYGEEKVLSAEVNI